jgi:hypothetical protein
LYDAASSNRSSQRSGSSPSPAENVGTVTYFPPTVAISSSEKDVDDDDDDDYSDVPDSLSDD